MCANLHGALMSEISGRESRLELTSELSGTKKGCWSLDRSLHEFEMTQRPSDELENGFQALGPNENSPYEKKHFGLC